MGRIWLDTVRTVSHDPIRRCSWSFSPTDCHFVISRNLGSISAVLQRLVVEPSRNWEVLKVLRA